MMRVLLVDDTLNVGGKERLVLTALRCLPRDRMSVHLCLTGSPGVLGGEALRLADDSIVCGRRSPFSPRVVRAISRFVSSRRIQILHCNGTVDLLHAWAAVRWSGARLVCSVHGHASGVHRLLGRFLLRRCDAVAPVSESLLGDMRRDGYRSRRFVVIPNCYDPAFGKLPSALRGPRPDDGSLRLVCVSRFDWSKDQLTLVRAVGRAVASGADARLDFVGDGRERYVQPVRLAVEELGLSERIRFLGTRRDVPALLGGYDAFALSSFAESFGIAAVEAMASGLPVMLSDIPPFRELVRGGRDGMLFPPGSPDAAARCISELAGSSSLRAGLAGKALARSGDFSPSAYAERLGEFYASLVEEGASSAGAHGGRP